jgi:hypothetical protein
VDPHFFELLHRLVDVQQKHPRARVETQLARALQRTFTCDRIEVIWIRDEGANSSPRASGTVLGPSSRSARDAPREMVQRAISQIRRDWPTRARFYFAHVPYTQEHPQLSISAGFDEGSIRYSVFLGVSDPDARFGDTFREKAESLGPFQPGWMHLLRFIRASKETALWSEKLTREQGRKEKLARLSGARLRARSLFGDSGVGAAGLETTVHEGEFIFTDRVQSTIQLLREIRGNVGDLEADEDGRYFGEYYTLSCGLIRWVANLAYGTGRENREADSLPRSREVLEEFFGESGLVSDALRPGIETEQIDVN